MPTGDRTWQLYAGWVHFTCIFLVWLLITWCDDSEGHFIGWPWCPTVALLGVCGTRESCTIIRVRNHEWKKTSRGVETGSVRKRRIDPIHALGGSVCKVSEDVLRWSPQAPTYCGRRKRFKSCAVKDCHRSDRQYGGLRGSYILKGSWNNA